MNADDHVFVLIAVTPHALGALIKQPNRHCALAAPLEPKRPVTDVDKLSKTDSR